MAVAYKVCNTQVCLGSKAVQDSPSQNMSGMSEVGYHPVGSAYVRRVTSRFWRRLMLLNDSRLPMCFGKVNRRRLMPVSDIISCSFYWWGNWFVNFSNFRQSRSSFGPHLCCWQVLANRGNWLMALDVINVAPIRYKAEVQIWTNVICSSDIKELYLWFILLLLLSLI